VRAVYCDAGHCTNLVVTGTQAAVEVLPVKFSYKQTGDQHAPFEFCSRVCMVTHITNWLHFEMLKAQKELAAQKQVENAVLGAKLPADVEQSYAMPTYNSVSDDPLLGAHWTGGHEHG
jgi:hypothetical protein